MHIGIGIRLSGQKAAAGGALTWTIRQGTGGQTIDLSDAFAPGANLWLTDDPDTYLIEAGVVTVDTDYLAVGEVTLLVTGGSQTKPVTITVQEFEPGAMFAAHPSWVGGFVDPSDLSSLFSDAAGTVPITGHGDTVRSYRLGSTLFSQFAASQARTYTDDGVNPPRMGQGMFYQATPITIGPELFVCSGQQFGSTAGGGRHVFSARSNSTTPETRMALFNNAVTGQDFGARIRTAGGVIGGGSSVGLNVSQTSWVTASVRITGNIMTYGYQGIRQEATRSSAAGNAPIETFARPIALGGLHLNTSDSVDVAQGTAAGVFIWNAAPSLGAWLLIERWVAERTSDASLFASFTFDPSIAPADPTFSDTLTVDKGLAFGAVSIDPTAQYFLDGADVTGSVTGGSYTVPASNANQFVQVSTAGVAGYTPDTVVVTHVEVDQGTTPSGEDNAPTVTASTYAHDGVKFTFGAPVAVGHYISGPGSGDIFIVDPGAGVTVTYSPAPALTTDAVPRRINGAMKNPGCNVRPGYDSRSAQYLAASNASLGAITLTAGDSLVVSLSNQNWQAGKESFMSRRFVVLTCVAATPKWDAFRPPYSWPTSEGAKPSYRFSQIDMADLPSLTSVAGAPAAASVAQIFRRPVIDTEPDFNRDYLASSGNGNRYGTSHLNEVGPLVGFLLSDASEADKRQPTINLVQAGIDLLGVVLDGQDRSVTPLFASDGGHNNGREFQLTVAGWLLGDAQFQAAIASNPNLFQEKGMTFYVDQDVVDVTNGGTWTPAYDYNGSAPYSQGMFDGGFPMPEWRGSLSLNFLNANFSAHPYRLGIQNSDNPNQMIQALFLLAAGLRATWNYDAFFDYQIRHWQMRTTGVDPWRLQGGVTPLYDSVPGLYSSPTIYSGWTYRMFGEHIFDFYSYPWEV